MRYTSFFVVCFWLVSLLVSSFSCVEIPLTPGKGKKTVKTVCKEDKDCKAKERCSSLYNDGQKDRIRRCLHEGNKAKGPDWVTGGECFCQADIPRNECSKNEDCPKGWTCESGFVGSFSNPVSYRYCQTP